jgi:hypothetical protein
MLIWILRPGSTSAYGLLTKIIDKKNSKPPRPELDTADEEEVLKVVRRATWIHANFHAEANASLVAGQWRTQETIRGWVFL